MKNNFRFATARRAALRAACLVLALAIPASLCACAPKTSTGESNAVEKTFFAMDTFMTISIYSSEEGVDKDAVIEECEEIVTDIETRMSRTLEGSEVFRFNQSEGGCLLSDDTIQLVERSIEMSELTQGAFDITVAPLVELWDIHGGGRVPSESEIETALQSVGYEHLSVDGNMLLKDSPSVMIDLGAVAKGYALERAGDFLRERGVRSALLNFGGSIYTIGSRPDGSAWRVGIKDPDEPSRLSGVYTISEGAVSVSGDYERFFIQDGVRYHHILSPNSGYPADICRSCAVITDDPTLADMLSTALFITGEEGAERVYESGLFEFEYIIITEDGYSMSHGAADSYQVG